MDYARKIHEFDPDFLKLNIKGVIMKNEMTDKLHIYCTFIIWTNKLKRNDQNRGWFKYTFIHIVPYIRFVFMACNPLFCIYSGYHTMSVAQNLK